MSAHRYRCTKVVTDDYGDGPAAGKVAMAHLVALGDGADWRSRPATLSIMVPLDTRPGGEFVVTIEPAA